MSTALKAAAQNDNFYLPDISVEVDSIQAVMINEVVPSDPEQDFYGKGETVEYMKTTIPLFQKAGITVNSITDIISMGIYITNAVKLPKSEYTIEKSSIEKNLDILEREISLFPNVKVIMLMGDVAKKAYNMITKKLTGKNVIPSGSTYKIRNEEFYYGNIRVIPSYIMTGGNILIEKSKFEMVSEDIKTMIRIINKCNALV
jgi:uracil-DNA glycosylase